MIPPDNEQDPNPILSAAFALFEGLAPGGLADPEKAMRDLVPQLRMLVVEKVAKPTIPQLQALRAFDKPLSLVQISKALQAGALQFGPFRGDLAERAFMPALLQQGLSASLRELTAAEQAEYLDDFGGNKS